MNRKSKRQLHRSAPVQTDHANPKDDCHELENDDSGGGIGGGGGGRGGEVDDMRITPMVLLFQLFWMLQQQ